MAAAFNVVTAIGQWVLNSHATEASQVTGGWERWAQLEIGFYIRTNNGRQTTFENHVFADAGRRDDISVQDLRPNFAPSVVELKCYNYLSEQFDVFRTRWSSDYLKLEDKADLDAAHQTSHRWAIGLANADRVVEWLRNRGGFPNVTRATYLGILPQFFGNIADFHAAESGAILAVWWDQP